MQGRLNMREPRGDPHRQHPMLRLLQSGGTLLAILLIIGCPAYANGQVCQDYEEVRKADHMSMAVSFEIPNPLIRQQFRHAMNFWASLLDMEWHTSPQRSSSASPGAVSKSRIQSDPAFICAALRPQRNTQAFAGIQSLNEAQAV